MSRAASGCEGCPLSMTNLVKGLHCRWVRYAAAAAATVFVGYKALQLNRARKLKKEQATFKKDIVYFYHLPRCQSLNQVSAPCQKLEMFLRLARIPYVAIETMDSSVSPTGRLPCIVFNGEVVPDSEMIIHYLHEKFPEHTKGLFALTSRQHNFGTLVRRLAECSVFIDAERACMVDNPEVVTRVCIEDLKMRPFAARMLARRFRKSVIQFLNNHGNGDVPDVQFYRDFANDVQAIEQILTDNKFAVGDAVSVYDASLFAAVSQLTLQGRAGAKCDPYKYIAQSAPIQRYFEYMQATYYADLPELCQPSAAPRSFFLPPKAASS